MSYHKPKLYIYLYILYDISAYVLLNDEIMKQYKLPTLKTFINQFIEYFHPFPVATESDKTPCSPTRLYTVG